MLKNDIVLMFKCSLDSVLGGFVGVSTALVHHAELSFSQKQQTVKLLG